MAKCDFCGKGVTFGIQVSHSHRRSNRPWKPNVKRVKAIVNGTPTHVYVCTRCLLPQSLRDSPLKEGAIGNDEKTNEFRQCLPL